MCAKLETTPEGVQLRVKALAPDFPNLAAQKKCVEATVGMIVTFQHQATQDAQAMAQLIAALGGKLEVTNILRDV